MAQARQKVDASTASTKRPSAKQLVDEFGLDPDSMSPVEQRSAISGYDVRHRIESMVAGITAKQIKHFYQGDGAATAPGMMILPRIPATHLFSLRHVRVLLGYTAHEISHQLKTDFGLLKAMIDDKSRPMRQIQQIKEFWNAIEDYRIEKLVRKEYPGFHVYIDDTRDFSAGRFCERVDAGHIDPKALSNPYQIGAVALTWIGAELNDYRTNKPREALNHLDPKLLKWIESWRADMAKVETCLEARDLAIVIVEELDRLRENEPDCDDDDSPQQQNKPPEPGQQQGQSTQNGQSQGQSQNDQQSDKPPEASDADGGSETSDQDSNSADDSPCSGKGSNDNSQDNDDANEGGEKGSSSNNPDTCDDDASAEQSDGSGHNDDTDNQDDAAQDSDDSNSDSEDSDASANSNNQLDDETDQQSGSRPNLDVNDGDEQAEAEAADLEIDDLSDAIRTLKGPEATDAQVHEGNDISGGRGASGGKAEEIVNQVIERGQKSYSEMRQNIAGAAARSAGILRRMLMSQTRRTWRGGREEGDLDFGRLVPMTQGLPDIYRQRVDRSGVNTAITLLLDNSGSMSGHPIRVCQQTAIVLDMAIQGTPTKVEIVGFTGTACRPILYRYRSFGQSGQAASASLGNMDQVALQGTPVSTPLLESWRRLSQQKEPRRILMVVSDGGADYNDVNAARQAHDFIVSQGCRVIGIAVGCADEMSAWCDNCVGIESIDELPVALTRLVQEAMR